MPRPAACLLLLAASVAARAQAPAPPPTARHASSYAVDGTAVADPYQWLEHPSDPAVQAWVAAQNAYADRLLGGMPEGPALAARVRQLAITSVTRSSPLLAGDTLFYLRETPPQPQPQLVAQPWPDGKAHVVVDPNGDHGNTAITGYWPSPSGRYLAYGTAEGGSELTTLHVLDVRSGRSLPDTLAWAGGGTTPQGVAWDRDEHGFDYVRFAAPPTGRPVRQFDAFVAHHALGRPQAQDAAVFGRHYGHAAEYVFVTAPARAHSAILAHQGDGDAAEVFVQRKGRFRRVLGREANARTAAWVGDRLLVAVFEHAPRGRVVAIDAEGTVRPLLAQGDGAIQQIAPLGDGFLVVRSAGPDWWAEQYDADARRIRRLPLPAHGIAIDGIASRSGQSRALIAYAGWTVPTRWIAYDGASGAARTVFAVKPAADYSGIRSYRLEGRSRDGTAVPVTVLAAEGVDPNGARPTILYGYGGFDIPVRPHFIGPELAWLERGGVLAFANIRGGNENGEAWHAQGQQLHKQNVFDDFHAAATALLGAHWTDRDHLGILGASNGGLLMGAELVQHPHDWRAVVARVGIYDVPAHELRFANGRYNVPEYGSVHDPAQRRATLAYSPLQNVAAGTAYPAVLMTTGANDPRVAPWQSRKFAAALQHASDSGRPVLLLTRMNAGHGIGAPFSQRVGDTAITLTFFAHELGLGHPAG